MLTLVLIQRCLIEGLISELPTRPYAAAESQADCGGRSVSILDGQCRVALGMVSTFAQTAEGCAPHARWREQEHPRSRVLLSFGSFLDPA